MRGFRSKNSWACLILALALSLGFAWNQAYTQTVGQTPFEKPNLTAFYEEGAIQLSWRASGDTRIVGFNLYRLTPDEGVWTRLNAQPIQALRYRDVLSDIPEMLTYRVVPVNAQGAEMEEAPIIASLSKSEIENDGEEPELSPGVLMTGNSIYTLFVGRDGKYTIRTGPSHPVPGRNLLYGGKGGFPATSFNSIRSWTTNTNYTQGGEGGGRSMAPYVTSNVVEGSGVRTIYQLPGPPQTPDKLRIEQLVRVNGTTFGNSTVEVTTTVTNTGATPVAIGVRYLWDLQIGIDDGPTFQEVGPDGPVRILETQFNAPRFTAYRSINNDFEPPLYYVYGTVTGPLGITPPPTPPDRLDFCCWASAFFTAFDYTVNPTRDIATTSSDCRGFAGGDTAIHYYFGNTPGTAINLAAGRSFSFSESIFGQQPRIPPRFDIPPTPPSQCPDATFRVQAGNRIQFPVQASHPTPGTNVTLGVSGLPTGATFPIPAPANPVSSTFTWTPTAAQVGFHTITFTATTAPDTVSHCIRLEVVPGPPPNRPPAFDTPPTPTTAPLNVRAADTLTFNVQATDPDFGDIVTLTSSALPADAGFGVLPPANPATGTFSWTPTRSQVGIYTITFTATDNHGASTQRIITIEVLPPGPDTVPPHCGPISVRPDPPRGLTGLVRDINSGLDYVVVSAMDNADVIVAPFTSGTNDRVPVTATKRVQGDPAFVYLDFADVAGNADYCQFVEFGAQAGQLSSTSYVVGTPSRGRLMIENRGLTDVVLYLNDAVVYITADSNAAGFCSGNICYMAPSGTTFLDLSPFLTVGGKTVYADAYGAPNTYVELLISE